MSDYPTIREELHRKTLDSLAWILSQQEVGVLTEYEAYHCMQALFIAVSGLVPRDVFEDLSMDEPSDKAITIPKGGTYGEEKGSHRVWPRTGETAD